jgi:hypothetical protein
MIEIDGYRPLPARSASRVPGARRSAREPHRDVDDDADHDEPKAHNESHPEPVPAVHRDTSFKLNLSRFGYRGVVCIGEIPYPAASNY